jgi:hypothetical protein
MAYHLQTARWNNFTIKQRLKLPTSPEPECVVLVKDGTCFLVDLSVGQEEVKPSAWPDVLKL